MASSDSDSDGSMPGLISNSDSSDESDASSDDEPWPRPDEPAAQPAAAAQPQREEPEPEPEPEPTNPDAPVATVHDIRARPEMNGRRVEAISFDAEKGRYRVREVGDVWRRNGEAAPWGADRIVMVRPDNLGFEGMAAAHAAAMRSAAEAAHRGAAQEAPGSQDAESGSDADQEEEQEQAEREAQKKKRVRERKKEQQRRARERKRLAAEQAKRMEPIEELTAREKMQKLAELMSGGAVATWSVDDATDWVKYIDLDLGDGPSDALVRVLAAFVEEEIDGEELTSMSRKRLQKMLVRAGIVAEQAEGVAESVLDRRDLAVAVQAAEGEGGAASSAELSALKSALEKAEQGKLKAEEELKEMNEDYEEMSDNYMKMTMQQRETSEQQSAIRAAALRAHDHGFTFPVREIGVLDCKTREPALPDCVQVEGELGVSGLQGFINDVKWHPVRIDTSDPDKPTEVINWEDERLVRIERRYRNKGVGSFVIGCWQELQKYNASGSYTVLVPWHTAFDRELTPQEVIEFMITNQKVKKRAEEDAGFPGDSRSWGPWQP